VVLEGRDGDEAHALFGRGAADLGPAQALVQERSRPHGASILTPGAGLG